MLHRHSFVYCVCIPRYPTRYISSLQLNYNEKQKKNNCEKKRKSELNESKLSFLLLSNANEHNGSSNGNILSDPWHDKIKCRLQRNTIRKGKKIETELDKVEVVRMN